MSKNPIHYRAWGKYGLAFDCYRSALSRLPEWPKGCLEGPKITPDMRVHATTSIDKVTCLACWDEIRKLAGKRWPKEDSPHG